MLKILLLLTFFLSSPLFAEDSEADLLWSIKINTQLVGNSLTELERKLKVDKKAMHCHLIGVQNEHYHLKRAVTNTYRLTRLNQNFGRDLGQLFSLYIQKGIAEFKDYCFSTNSQLLGKSQLLLKLREVKEHVFKADTMIRRRLDDI